MEDEPRDDVPETARLDRSVGRLEDDRERDPGKRSGGGEERGEGVLIVRELLPAEEEEADVESLCRRLREIPDELERDREPALHVARTEPVDGAAVDPAGSVSLSRNGVVVAGEDDERGVRAELGEEEERVVRRRFGTKRSRDEPEQMLLDHRLVPTLGRDVDELESAGGKTVTEVAHRAGPSLVSRRIGGRRGHGIIPL